MITAKSWKKIFELRDGFLKEYAKVQFYPYQIEPSNEIIKSIILNQGKTIITEFARQSGKTEDIADTVLFLACFYFNIAERFALHHPSSLNIGIFAPQKEQAKTDFDRIKDRLRLVKDDFGISYDEANGNTLKLSNGCTIFCFSASPTSHTESKTLHLIIYEEAQDLTDFKIDKTISPMGAATNATEVFIGTAGYSRCRFLQHIEKGDTKFIFPWQRIIEEKEAMYQIDKNPFHLNYKTSIEKRKREIGEDSDEFKTQYELVWILERGQFITYENLVKLENDYEIREAYTKFDEFYVGIDWGKMSDSTVVTVLDSKCRIIYWLEMQGDDYNSQIETIVDVIKRKFYGTKKIICDRTASQDMAIDVLKAKLRTEGISASVEGIAFTLESKDQMYKNLSRLMHSKMMDGRVIDEPVLQFNKGDSLMKEKFIKQFIDLQKEIKNNRWSCNHPEGPNYHDDYCDSLALAATPFKEYRKQQRVWSVY